MIDFTRTHYFPFRSALGGVATLLLILTSLTSAEDIAFDDDVHAFVGKYCLECHGAEKQKGDRAFHEMVTSANGKISIDLSDHENQYLLEDILDQLNLGEMPPKKKGVKQPTSEEISLTAKWITKTLLNLEEDGKNQHTVLRRLNRREYKNTVEDLLGLHDLTTDPTSDFPVDDVEEGFTNIGEALNLSESHLDQYLNAADQYLRMGIFVGDRPETKKIEIKPEDWGYPEKESTTPWIYRLQKPGEYIDIGGGEKDLSNKVYMISYPNKAVQQGGIKEPGYYKIRVSATAVRRLTHGYDPKMIPVDLSRPMQLGLYIATTNAGLHASGEGHRKRIGLWDLSDHNPEDFEVTVWLGKGAVPFLNWDNGPGPSDYWMRDICKKYHTDIEFRGKQGAHGWHVIGENAVPGRVVSDVWNGPLVRVRKFSFTGPLPETWQSQAQKRFFKGKNTFEYPEIKTAMQSFVSAAFRRPVKEEEVKPYINLFTNTRKMGRNQEDALRVAMQAVLVSPEFLYLKEIGNSDGSLTAHELANRLSYFLWSSMPDKTLSSLADNGALSNPKVLLQQARRMLQNSKSNALVDGLCESWLRLDKLGSMPPDSNQFREYYLYQYENLFREETHQFVGHILHNNLPINHFIKSNYTFVNEDLAKHYQIDGVEGLQFRKVVLLPEHRRGGLLGHASIQTLTANGVDTTPVVRGVWVLENILGTPPSPPPPDVEALDSDTRGAVTIRDRLAKHRTVETCADCHNKIDPYGFPFEFYDAVGGYRDRYFRNRRWVQKERKSMWGTGPKVNGWAKLETGEGVRDLSDLQNVLLIKEKQFKRALVEKLMVYSTGRKMTFRDHDAIDKIVDSETAGFRDLILAVVDSLVFRQR